MTSYANSGGTGARTGIITVTSAGIALSGAISTLVDGSFGNNTSVASNWNTITPAAGLTITFNFGSGRIIDEAKWYQDVVATHGVWQWRGSNDGVSYTNIGATLTLGSGASGGATTPQVMTTLNGNTTIYQYYQLLGVSGSTSNVPWNEEVEFKINTAYTLALANGSFTLTGQAIVPKRGLHLIAATGSFAMTGFTAGLVKGYHLALATGSFSFTGIAAIFTRVVSPASKTARRISKFVLQKLRVNPPTLGD